VNKGLIENIGNPYMATQDRLISIDILRGFAIFTMVAANLAGEILIAPHPFVFRFYGTWAAAIFIFVSGMMVAYSAQKKKRELSHFLKRGGMILMIAVLFDLVSGKYPFVNVDVLYLIGLSIPLAYGFTRLKALPHWVIITAIFAATPILQVIIGYSVNPPDFLFFGDHAFVLQDFGTVLHSWIIDGWFPIFPWLGFSLLGAAVGPMYFKWVERSKAFSAITSTPSPAFNTRKIVFVSVCLLCIGSIFWWLYPGALYVREGYSELFYPPTLGYIISAIGVILLLLALSDYYSKAKVVQSFRLLGESPLFFYILHETIIFTIISPIWGIQDFLDYFLIYVGLMMFLFLIGFLLRIVKAKWPHRHYIIKFLLGG
jgi:uncharacterized membrane protein